MNNRTATFGIKPNRRTLLKGAGAASLVLGAPAILRAQTTSITFPNSGGAWEDAARAAFYDPFTAKTGMTVVGAPYMDTARVKSMVENNAVDVDIMNIDATEAAALARLGLLEELDFSGIDTGVMMDGTVNQYYSLLDVASYIMSWNTQFIDAEMRPTSWAEYFDTQGLPGQRSLWKLAPQTLDVAAMAGGQMPDSLYPLDLDLAFSQLDKIRDDLTWWTSGAQGAQLVIDGEVDLGTVWNGRVFQAKIDGAPVDYTFDQALYVCDAIVIPKGAKNKEASMEFLATMLEAKNQAEFSKRIPYGPVNSDAFEFLDDSAKALLPNSPENNATGKLQNFDYWAENGPEVFDRFNSWLLG